MISKKINKAIVLVLIAIMAVGTMNGCSRTKNGSEEGNSQKTSTTEITATEGVTKDDESVSSEDYAKHLEISMAFWNVEGAFSSKDDVLKTIEDKFNVTFVPQNISWDDYQQKIQLWAASGSLPDIFAGDFRTGSNFNTWATQGLLKEIPADLSSYPNLKEYLNSPELVTCQINGKTYSIFRQTYSEQAETAKDRLVAYRWDLAQKAGVTKEPSTWEEFDNMIQKIVQVDPDNKNIKGMTGIQKLMSGIFYPYSMPLAAQGGASFYWVDKGDGTFVPAYFAGDTFGSAAIPALNLARKMYDNGSIEKDIGITTDAQAVDKFLQGQSAALAMAGGAGGHWRDLWPYWKDVHGNDALDDIKFLNLMPDVNGDKAYPIWDYAWSESYISSAVDDEKLDRILAIYDYMLTKEGLLLSKFGIEGKTYNIESDGKLTYIDDKMPSDTYASMTVLHDLVCWNQYNLDSTLVPYNYPQAYVDINNQITEEARQVVIPKYNYDCTTAFIQMGSKFTINVEDDLLNIMTGNEPVDKMWNKTLEEYKANGVDDIISKVNEAVK